MLNVDFDKALTVQHSSVVVVNVQTIKIQVATIPAN